MTLRHLLITGAILAVTIFLFTQWDVRRLESLSEDNAANNQPPDIVITNASTAHYDEGGKHTYDIAGPLSLHYEKGDLIQFQQPHVILYPKDGSAQWQLTADSAESTSDHQRATLNKNVRIWQNDPTAGSRELTTPHLVLYPDRQYAETDHLIKLKTDTSSTTAKGMKAWMKEQRIQLLSNVREHYEAN